MRATSDTSQTSKTGQDVNLETWATVTKKRKRTNSGDSNVQTIINRFDEGNNKVTPKIKKNNDVKESMGKNQNKNKNKTLVIVLRMVQSCDTTRADLRARLDPRKQQSSEFRNENTDTEKA